MLQYKLGQQITVIKLSPQGEEQVRYTGQMVEYLPHGIILHAHWTGPRRDLGYTCFEPGDLFREYFYTDRWFNVFAISDCSGAQKGWYCNIAEPAQFDGDTIRQVDLFLDVWINPAGTALILDEEEFALAPLSAQQNSGALRGLSMLLKIIKTGQEMFSHLQVSPCPSRHHL